MLAEENFFPCAHKSSPLRKEVLHPARRIPPKTQKSIAKGALETVSLPTLINNITQMASIHEGEDRILKKLSETYPTNVDRKYRSYPDHHPAEKLIVSDGLHYLGTFSYEENGCWKRVSGEEEKRWKDICGQNRGLVVLTKDLNDSEVWDMRMDHGRKNGDRNAEPSSGAFYENLRRWIYGLITMSDSGEMPEYPTNEEAQKHFEEEPWVRVNLKKEAGKGSITPTVLRRHIKAAQESLKEQLKLYEGASVYLDCTRREGIKLLKERYKDIKAFGGGNDEWIYYSEEHHFIIVNSYHPSYSHLWGESKRKAYYKKMRKAVQAFFVKHPNFFK